MPAAAAPSVAPGTSVPPKLHRALLAVAFVVISSSNLVLNAASLRVWPKPASLASLQLLVSSVTCGALGQAGVVELAVSLETARPFTLFAMIYTARVYSSLRALAVANVGAVLLARSCVPLAVCLLEWWFLGRQLPSWRSTTALMLIGCGTWGYVYYTPDKTLLSDTWLLVYYGAFSSELAFAKAVSPVAGLWTRTFYSNALALPPVLLILLATEPLVLPERRLTVAALLALSCAVFFLKSVVGWKLRAMVDATSYSLLTVFSNVATAVGTAQSWRVVFLLASLVATLGYAQAPKRAHEQARCAEVGASCRKLTLIAMPMPVAWMLLSLSQPTLAAGSFQDATRSDVIVDPAGGLGGHRAPEQSPADFAPRRSVVDPAPLTSAVQLGHPPAALRGAAEAAPPQRALLVRAPMGGPNIFTRPFESAGFDMGEVGTLVHAGDGKHFYCRTILTKSCLRDAMLKFKPEVLLRMTAASSAVYDLYHDIIAGRDPLGRQLLPALSRSLSIGQHASTISKSKSALLGLAQSLGIAVPKALSLGPMYKLTPSVCEGEGPGKVVGWPFMLKSDAHAGQGVQLVESSARWRDRCLAYLTGKRTSMHGVLRAEAFVEGLQYAQNGVLLSGRVLASYQRIKAATMCPVCASTIATITETSTVAQLRAMELLAARLNYSGFLGLEFRHMPDGSPLLVDFNARLSEGSITPVEAAGLFPLSLPHALSVALSDPNDPRLGPRQPNAKRARSVCFADIFRIVAAATHNDTSANASAVFIPASFKVCVDEGREIFMTSTPWETDEIRHNIEYAFRRMKPALSVGWNALTCAIWSGDGLPPELCEGSSARRRSPLNQWRFDSEGRCVLYSMGCAKPGVFPGEAGVEVPLQADGEAPGGRQLGEVDRRWTAEVEG